MRTNTVLAIFAALVIIAVGGVAIAAIVVKAEEGSLQRFCFSDETTKFLGSVSLQTNQREIQWKFQFDPAELGPVSAIQIKGPVPPGSVEGPLYVALCGTPSLIACDTSVVGESSGTLTRTSPEGYFLTAYIHAIRAAPWTYYVEINGLKLRFTSQCGSP